MRPPKFWYQSGGLLPVLLSPVALIASWLGAKRLARGAWQQLSVPVICVGNINLGGTGKTPTVIALTAHLRELGLTPHVVSRGYGGRITAPVKVDERAHTAAQVGDEPLLLAAFCDTWVAKDRRQGALLAIKAGADVIILDDGLQDPGLRKDMAIIVVDAKAGFGNGRVFPAGPLREPMGRGFKRADLVLVIGAPKDQLAFKARWQGKIALPIVLASLKPLETGMTWQDQRFLAFAGIGHPEKFFDTLRGLGAQIIRSEALADHQALPPRLMHRLEAEAIALNAQLVTTEKDAARLPDEFRSKVITLPVRLHVHGWQVIDAKLEKLGIKIGS